MRLVKLFVVFLNPPPNIASAVSQTKTRLRTFVLFYIVQVIGERSQKHAHGASGFDLGCNEERRHETHNEEPSSD